MENLLMNIRDAAPYLNIDDPTTHATKRLTQYMVRVEIRVNTYATRLYPRRYILRLGQYLNGRRATVELVQSFNQSNTGQRLLRYIYQELSVWLNAETHYSGLQIARALGVGPATISNCFWAGVFGPPNQARRGSIESFRIPTTSIRRVIHFIDHPSDSQQI